MAMELDIQKLNQTVICYADRIYKFNGLWDGPDPLRPLLILFCIHLIISCIVIHSLVYCLRPLNQPPIVAEIIGGIILGPSVLGRIQVFRRTLFPTYAFRTMEPMAHFSIVYYAFLTGLKMDLKGILRTGPKAMKVAVAGIVVPFIVGAGIYFLYYNSKEFNKLESTGCVFWGGALAVTGFSVLTKILENQQILHTEIGKTAVAAALISDICSWAFLAFGFSISGSESTALYSVICTIAFVLVSAYYIRPGLRWIIRKTPEGQGYNEFYICSILAGMSLSSVFTDVIGTHPMIGAFVFGLIIPNEVLEATILDKLEDFVTGILMPVYFLVCGLRTNIDQIANNWLSGFVVLLVVVLSCSLKVISALIATMFCDLRYDEALAVGFMGNAKSIMAFIILESGQVQGALSTRTYTIMVLAALLMSITVAPLATWLHPASSIEPYNHRTIQNAKKDDELRILACIYNTRNIPTIIHLLRTSNATHGTPMKVFALQLVELVGRAFTSLVVHNPRKAGPRNPSHIEAQADQIITAFDNYELRSEGVVTQVLTAQCPYTTMDKDICNVARENRAALVILPFHKQQTMDGEMEDINPSIRSVNEGVLANAPCSVAILVDRGSSEFRDHAQNICMLFLGGPDDREALSYAWRMAEGTDSNLMVVRFIASLDAMEMDSMGPIVGNHVSLEIDNERERLLDDDFLSKFKTSTANCNSISYCELLLDDEEEAVKAIISMDEYKHDLYMVGRGRGMVSLLTSGLADWCDCPELGPIGDLLVTSEFESKFSLLIVQQHSGINVDGSFNSASSTNFSEEDNVRPSVSGSYDSFGSFKRRDHVN